ncbi:MAG: 4'-phosphopantetheinyl transferase superfamily protein [Deltaproteobacteria bacterium]|nr:4'-phosphopantetheinyl transferase superfamily protein [Deltaproteobacteria bacterium]
MLHQGIVIEYQAAEEGNDALLFGPEAEYVRSLGSESRKGEFAAGRIAARRALEQLGLQKGIAVPRSETGLPEWPKNIVGSISHTRGLAVAAAAKSDAAAALGVDIELSTRALKGALERRVLSEEERKVIRGEGAGLLAFCAKEAVYKCLASLGAPTFWFREVTLKNMPPLGENPSQIDCEVTEGILKRCGLEKPPEVLIWWHKEFIVSLARVYG